LHKNKDANYFSSSFFFILHRSEKLSSLQSLQISTKIGSKKKNIYVAWLTRHECV